MMPQRRECMEGYLKLVSTLDDLESSEFGEHWFYRAAMFLITTGCSYRYGILIKLAKDKLREGRGSGIDRDNNHTSLLKKQEEVNSILSKGENEIPWV